MLLRQGGIPLDSTSNKNKTHTQQTTRQQTHNKQTHIKQHTPASPPAPASRGEPLSAPPHRPPALRAPAAERSVPLRARSSEVRCGVVLIWL